MHNLENNTAETAAVSAVPTPMEAPLEHKWCLYFDRYIGPGFSADEYAAAIAEICTLDSVPTYWSWFNNLPNAGDLDPSCTYHLMKSGIRPLWFVIFFLFFIFLFLFC